MIVDCDRCAVRGPAACGDCVVTVLLGRPPGGVELAPREQAALAALAGAGLVPPLRLVPEHGAGDPGRGAAGEAVAVPLRAASGASPAVEAPAPRRHWRRG